VRRITNETGKSFGHEINVEDMLRQAFTEKLAADYLLCSNITPKKLGVRQQNIDYDKGYALKRWLLPGRCATVLTIQCDLRQDGQFVGTTVSAGVGTRVEHGNSVFTNLAGSTGNIPAVKAGGLNTTHNHLRTERV
jgi:hypothetical protein